MLNRNILFQEEDKDTMFDPCSRLSILRASELEAVAVCRERGKDARGA